MLPEDVDKDLVLRHPALQWVTLVEGNAFFRKIHVHCDCKSLRLLKFRDFELEDFVNDANARFWSEKNLLNDQDFL